jgi:hypothetical protein
MITYVSNTVLIVFLYILRDLYYPIMSRLIRLMRRLIRIMNTMYDYISDGYSKSKCIRMALQMYKNKLGAFFYEDSDTGAIAWLPVMVRR